MCKYLPSWSSSCRAASMDIPDPLSPLLPNVHFFRQVLMATSRIGTDLLYVYSGWSSSLWRLCEGIQRSDVFLWIIIITIIENPESVPINEIHKIFWGFEIQTEHLISTILRNSKKDQKQTKKKKRKGPAELWTSPFRLTIR